MQSAGKPVSPKGGVLEKVYPQRKAKKLQLRVDQTTKTCRENTHDTSVALLKKKLPNMRKIVSASKKCPNKVSSGHY
jgi:hypothetical protein